MKCRDLMTPAPVVGTEADDCAVAAQLMRDFDCGCLPVVDSVESMKIRGIVTDRDICCRLAAEDRRATETSIVHVMSHGVVTCHEDDPVDFALERMAVHQVRRIPVIDQEGRLVGVIAQADLTRAEETKPHVEEVVESVSRASGSTPATLQFV